MTEHDYIHTFHGICPDCKESTDGHVTGNRAAGVYGWKCPRCGGAWNPDDVTPATTDAQRDALASVLGRYVRAGQLEAVDTDGFDPDDPATTIYVRARPTADGGPPEFLTTLAVGLGFHVDDETPPNRDAPEDSSGGWYILKPAR